MRGCRLKVRFLNETECLSLYSWEAKREALSVVPAHLFAESNLSVIYPALGASFEAGVSIAGSMCWTRKIREIRRIRRIRHHLLPTCRIRMGITFRSRAHQSRVAYRSFT